MTIRRNIVCQAALHGARGGPATLGSVEFPDGTPEDDMLAALDGYLCGKCGPAYEESMRQWALALADARSHGRVDPPTPNPRSI